MNNLLGRLPILSTWQREFAGYSLTHLRSDILAGLTTGAVALPLALAFGVASGADAPAGLITAILAGLIIGGLGGAAYQISGPTGAMSAMLIAISARYGIEGVWVATLLAGLIMIGLGLARLGRYIAFIPSSVIAGFTSGIALIIAIGQLDNVLGIQTPKAKNALEKLLHLLHPSPDPRLAYARHYRGSDRDHDLPVTFSQRRPRRAGWDYCSNGDQYRSRVECTDHR
jgi:SulP family sulfate permease